MALAFANIKRRQALGGEAKPLFVMVDITLDGSYPAGGYPVLPTDVGLGSDDDIVDIECGPCLNGANLLLSEWDEATNKLRVFYPTGGSAAAPATPAQPVATVVPDAGAVTMTGSAAKPTLTATTTPGAGKEVPTAAVLTGYVMKAKVWPL